MPVSGPRPLLESSNEIEGVLGSMKKNEHGMPLMVRSKHQLRASVGMRNHNGVATKMFDTLSNESINIEMISTSEIKISVVIKLADGERAVKAVHAAFLEG